MRRGRGCADAARRLVERVSFFVTHCSRCQSPLNGAVSQDAAGADVCGECASDDRNADLVADVQRMVKQSQRDQLRRMQRERKP